MLSHYRILDLTDHRGQLAGQLLASLGAEVILVEPPGGSPARTRPPLAVAAPVSLEWWVYSRGKKSVVVDNATALLELVQGADVLIESAGPGSLLSRWKLDVAAVAEANPSIVHVTITPFGSTGPKSGWAASDLTIAAAAYSLTLTGDADRPPIRTTVPQVWLNAAGEAACGALVALRERDRSGQGQHVDVSAQIAQMQAAFPGTLYVVNGNDPVHRVAGGMVLGGHHIQFVYPAADGYVSITLGFGDAVGPFTANLLRWVYDAGFCDEAMRDTDWSAFGLVLFTETDAPARWHAATAAVTALTKSMTKAELFEEAQRRRVLLAPVATPAELLDLAHLHERGYWRRYDDPELGAVCAPGNPVCSSIGATTPLGLPPRIDEHGPSIRGIPRAPAVRPTDLEVRAPLDGLKVVDLTWAFAGPLATRVLADHGATVVKVEGPTRPDGSRGATGRIKGDDGLNSSTQFGHLNAGKYSLALDLGVETGRAVLKDLAVWADVLIESYSPGVMAAWGLGYDELRRVNPGLVMVSTSLMGQTGPLSTFAGFGNLAAAITGFYELTGWPDRSPAGPFLAYTDYISPRITVTALLAAVEHRARTGVGQYLDLAQAEAAIQFLATAIVEHSVNGTDPSRLGNADPFFAPHGVFPSSGDDRWIAIACETDEQWAALAGVIGGGADPSMPVAERLRRVPELEAAVATWTAQRSAAEAEEVLQAAGVPAHRVQNHHEIAADPQLAHLGHWRTVRHPVHGQMVVEGARQLLSRTPAEVTWSGPALGEHNDLVLRKLLGYDDDQIFDLVVAGALG